MLWPLVLPFKITVGILVVLIVLAMLLSLKLKWPVGKAFGISLLLGAVAFVPSCTGIMKVMDSYRFGVFEYETADAVSDAHVKYWLPATAKSIMLDQQSNGFRANFTISQQDLDSHFDQQWKQCDPKYLVQRSGSVSKSPTKPTSLEREFGGLKWQVFDDMIEYRGPIADNGAGYSIWYSPSQAIAFQSAGYWVTAPPRTECTSQIYLPTEKLFHA